MGRRYPLFNVMEYQVPDLCVMSITPDEKTGKVLLDMPSKWDTSPQPPVLVTQKTIDYVMKDLIVFLCVPLVVPIHPLKLNETISENNALSPNNTFQYDD